MEFDEAEPGTMLPPLAFPMLKPVLGLVLRFIRFIHRDAPVLAFPAKAGTHVWHGHRPSPV
jgi:hypothetical protein